LIRVIDCKAWQAPLEPRTERLVEYVPGMRPCDLVPQGWPATAVLVNGKLLKDGELEDPRVLSERALCHTVAGPMGGEVGAALVNALVSAAIGFALSKVLGILFPGPDDPTDLNDATSQTYGWRGITTIYRGVGLPIPMPFGEMRTGGIVIQSWIDNARTGNQAVSVFNALILLGGPGPMQSIGGITVDSDFLEGEDLPAGLLINGNSAENYENVSVSLRLGSLDQEPMPGFNQIRTQFSVDLPIDQVDTPETPVVDWSMAAAYDLVGGDGFSAATIGIVFPGGLVAVSSGGTPNTGTVVFEIRYIELVSGVPSGSYSPVQTITVQASILDRFFEDVTIRFFDPATITGGSGGSALQLNNTTGSGHFPYLLLPGAGFTSVNIPGGSWSDGDEPDEFTFECWFRPDLVAHMTLMGWVDATSHPAGQEGRLDEDAAIKGLQISLNNANGFQGVYAIFGDGTLTGGFTVKGDTYDTVGVKDNGAVFATTPGAEFAHVVFTYKKEHSGSLNRVRLYVNGVQAEEVLTPTDLLFPGTEFMLAESDPFVLTNSTARVSLEQTMILASELTPNQVITRYNSGLGTYQTNVTSPVALWRFDAIVAGTPDTIADEVGSADLEITDTKNEALVTGHILTPTAGTPMDSDWRVEVQRLTAVFGRNEPAVRDEARFGHIIGIVYEALAYPEMALIGLQVQASEQLSGNEPNITLLGEWMEGLSWDGVDPVDPATTLGYTRNNAWICARVATDEVNGLGQYFKPSDIAWPSFLDWANWCDERVADRLGQKAIFILRYINDPTHGDVLRFEFGPGVTPLSHWTVGYELRMQVTDSANAPAWLAQLLAVDTFTIVAVRASASNTIDCTWPPSVPPNPNPVVYFVNATGDDIDCQGSHARHQFDGVLERRGQNGWDALRDIARAGRAHIFRVGRKLWAKPQKARTPSFIFNDSNIVQGSFRLQVLNRKNAFNRGRMEILKDSEQHARTLVSVDHPVLSDATKNVRLIPQDMRYIGITRESHAARELTFMLRAVQSIRFRASWVGTHETMLAQVGEIAYVNHALPEWGFGGRALADSATAAELYLDTAIEIVSGETYTCALFPLQDDKIYTATVSLVAGSYPRGAAVTLSGDFTDADSNTIIPLEGDRWVLGALTDTVLLFEIDAATMAQNEDRTFDAHEYVESAYDDNDFEDFPTTSASELLVSGLDDDEFAIPKPPQRANAEETTYRDSAGGMVRPSIHVSWSPHPDTSHLIGETIIWVQWADLAAPLKLKSVPPGEVQATIDDPRIEAGREYDIFVQTVSKNGSRRSPNLSIRVSVFVFGYLPAQIRPANLTIEMNGDRAVYILSRTDSARQQVDFAVEIRRGGFWMVGSRIMKVPAGTDAILGPTANYAGLPASATTGISNPCTCIRYVLSNGSVSRPFQVRLDPQVQQQGTPLKQVSVEDGNWNSAADTADLPAISTDILRDTAFTPPRLHFNSVTALQADYDSAIWVLDDPVRAHVAMEFEGWQEHPMTGFDPLMEGTAAQSRRAENWGAFEGPWSPLDPEYGRGQVQIWWRYTEDDVLSDKEYRRYSPTEVLVKRFQFRFRFKRPTDDWDVWVTRFAINVLPKRPEAMPDILYGGTYT